MEVKILETTYHRNGVGGEGFQVFKFKCLDEEIKGRDFMAVWFPGDGLRIAVFDLLKLGEGDIAFGSNSWRGDHFHDALKRAGAEFIQDECEGLAAGMVETVKLHSRQREL